MDGLKKLKNGLLFVFLVGCTGVVPPVNYPPNSTGYNHSTGYQTNNYPPLPRDEQDYNNRIAKDPNRAAVLKNSRDRLDGNSCENEDTNHECRSLCKEMYRRKYDREECEELSVVQIEKLLDVHKKLKEADIDDLERIDFEDLKVYLNVSIAGFDNLIRDYKRNDAKEVLTWIAEDEEAAELLREEDDDYKTLEELLKQISSFSDTEIEEPFSKELNSRDGTLFEMAMHFDNDPAIEWFLDYIFSTDRACTGNNRKVSAACFTVICEIGKEFNDQDYRVDWLDFPAFENYIDDIIDKEVNRHTATGGTNNNCDKDVWTHCDREKWDGTTEDKAIEDIDDIPDEDFFNLCGGLL